MGFALGLFLLGVGWNAGLIAGSTLLASAVPIAQRPRIEGVGELGMGVAAASATAVAGPVVGLAGYATLRSPGRSPRRRSARSCSPSRGAVSQSKPSRRSGC